MQRRAHRRTSNEQAVQRQLHKDLREPHITPLSILSNGQLAATFAIEYVRNFHNRRRKQYEKKQVKEKIPGEGQKKFVANGKKQKFESNPKAAETPKRNDESEKGETGVVCEDIVAQHSTS